MGGGVVALVCAVSAEERMLRRFSGPGVRIIVTGMGAGAAEQMAGEAIEAGVTAAISVGFCGALDRSLARGDVVVPEEVRDGATGEAWPCDAALARGAGRMRGTLVTAHQVVSDPAARERLDGIAVDMESAGTARACMQAGIPFAVIRAVTDRADDRLPDMAGVVDDAGGVHPLAALRRIAARPSDIPAWVRLGQGARAARRGLVPAVAAVLADAA